MHRANPSERTKWFAAPKGPSSQIPGLTKWLALHGRDPLYLLHVDMEKEVFDQTLVDFLIFCREHICRHIIQCTSGTKQEAWFGVSREGLLSVSIVPVVG
jgi:hypothetical protein